MGKTISCIIANRKIVPILSVVLVQFILSSYAIGHQKCNNANVTIENDFFQFELASDGRNLHFIDKVSGADYLDGTSVSYCAYILRNGEEFRVSAVSIQGDILNLKFSSAELSAKILVKKYSDHIDMEVVDVDKSADALTFFNVPLSLKGMPSEPFAACVLSMNLFTHVQQLPALQSHLWAKCYKRFGMKGAKITVIGVPQRNVLPVIRDVMQRSKDIPYSTVGGAWARLSKEGYGSYVMNFGSLNEKTVDEWIEKCKSVGFNEIDSYGGTDFFKFGSFELNSEKWPGGWSQIKRINDRLHDAGISSILHTYSFFIQKDSKYVTPIPSKDLAYFGYYTLAKSIGPEDSVIVVNESTEGIAKTNDLSVLKSRTIRLGNELIEYKSVTSSPPYKFMGCKRGTYNTKPATDEAGEKVYNLKEMFGMFVPDPDTQLFAEIARNTAKIVNDNDFDGIYLDAMDGSPILDGDTNAWYYGTKFIVDIAKDLKHPVGMEMSSMGNIWWHYRSRWEAWDAPVRGYKRFIDIHCAAINGGLLLPLHLGWWLNHTWDPPQTEMTFTDDIEYLGCKMIGNNAGLSLLGGIDKKELDEKPAFKRLNEIIRQYEELERVNYFGDDIKKQLREPGKEFTLFKQNRFWNFKPVTYQKHQIDGLYHPSANWNVYNEFGDQLVMLRIESLLSAKPYRDPTNILLTDFSNPVEFTNIESAKGVLGGIRSSGEKTENGESCMAFYATSSGASNPNASWTMMEKKFEPSLDLSKNRALGVWIKGDGNGELLDLRLKSPVEISNGARGDHFIKIDFTGWRYFQLVEIESAEYSIYEWPDAGNVYDSYRNTIKFNNVSELQLWYNNIPANKEVKCLIGPIKAIPTIEGEIDNPCVTVDGKKIVFPIRMKSGMYLEFLSRENCILYGPNGEMLKKVIPIGMIPDVPNGLNKISFSADGLKNARLQVTIINNGKPLKE